MKKDVSKAAAILGSMGGKAGTGKSKIRGDSEYYKRIRKQVGKKKSASNQT